MAAKNRTSVMAAEGKALVELVGRIVTKYRDNVELSPSFIATTALVELHGVRLQKTKPLIYQGCHLYLRQIARGHCRDLFASPNVRGDAQHEMFPDLQWRYPKAHAFEGEEPVYVLLDNMTDEDIAYNVARLRAEADAKQKHADALEAYGMRRRLAA